MQDTNGRGMHYRELRLPGVLSILFVINSAAIGALLLINSTTKRAV